MNANLKYSDYILMVRARLKVMLIIELYLLCELSLLFWGDIFGYSRIVCCNFIKII